MCGGVAPLAVEGKALGSPRGIWKPVPCESPSSEPCDVSSQHSAMYRVLPSQQSYDLPLHLSYRGLSIRRVYCTQLHSSECPSPKPYL